LVILGIIRKIVTKIPNIPIIPNRGQKNLETGIRLLYVCLDC
jgi:hypothetical protein